MNFKFWERGKSKRKTYSLDESNYFSELRGLAQNLITLEVNTIVKENMVAGPTPTVPNALIEIAYSYIRRLADLRFDVRDVYECKIDSPDWESAKVIYRPHTPPAEAVFFEPPSKDISFNHLFTFLRWAARNSQTQYRNLLESKEDVRITLRRIEDNSDKLRIITQSQPSLGKTIVTMEEIRTKEDIYDPPYELSLRDRLTIKKIWEVGSERVIAQTVIQIDGDVVTRVPRDFGQETDVQRLLDLHQQGLSTAVGRWDALMRAAKAVIEGLIGMPSRG